jgi:hypothetical protein
LVGSRRSVGLSGELKLLASAKAFQARKMAGEGLSESSEDDQEEKGGETVRRRGAVKQQQRGEQKRDRLASEEGLGVVLVFAVESLHFEDLAFVKDARADHGSSVLLAQAKRDGAGNHRQEEKDTEREEKRE